MLETSRRSLMKGAIAFLIAPALASMPAIAAYNPKVEKYNSYIKLLTAKLKEDIGELLNSYTVFEPNDEVTRENTKQIISAYLDNFKSMGSYLETVGNTYIEDWKIVCDDSNNDNRRARVNIDIYIKPVRDVGFIHFQASAMSAPSSSHAIGNSWDDPIWPRHKLADKDYPSPKEVPTRILPDKPLTERQIQLVKEEISRKFALWDSKKLPQELTDLIKEQFKGVK